MLRQLDLSSNKLQLISTELFTLPHLEWLNLANNSIAKLPAVQSSHVRAIPIYSLDLSGNLLTKFYDYVLHLALVVDLSYNRLKILPKKSISKLTDGEVMSRVLKLEGNPMVDPPIEACVGGLKSIREYFEEEARHIQLNKGFKIVILGDCKSGKTSLAYALEDFHTKSNLIEQYHTSGPETEQPQQQPTSESKLVEVHEFYMNAKDDEEADEMLDRLVERKTGATTPGQQQQPTRVGSANRSERRESRTIGPVKLRPGAAAGLVEERRGSRVGSARLDKNRRTSLSKSVSQCLIAKLNSFKLFYYFIQVFFIFYFFKGKS